MHKRRLSIPRVVFILTLLMGLPTTSLIAGGHSSSAGESNTLPKASATANGASVNEQITLLKQQMALQQSQIEQLQKTLEEQKRLLEKLTQPGTAVEQARQPARPATGTEQTVQSRAANLGEVASASPMVPASPRKIENFPLPAVKSAATVSAARHGGNAGTETSPLQIHIGDATITPVAFMDFASVYRSHSTNGNAGTNFGNIPYAGTSAYAPNLSEFRLSSENSRLGMRLDANVRGAHVIGYMEADFHGYNLSNVAVATNSNTLRERLYWVDVNTGRFEVLGGQAWSLITPGRRGISSITADVFYSQDIDLSYQAGLVFARVPELRFVYHPSKTAALAFAIDSPDQYAGGNAGSGTITLPGALNSSAAYQGELDYGAGNTLSTPTVAPDFIAKLALDPGQRVHFEIGGIERNFKVYNPINANKYSAAGGGGFVNANVEVLKGLHLLANNFWSDGGGRYIYGEAPDLIAHADGSISLLHSGSTVDGFEFAHKNNQIFGYYSGIYIARNTAIDANGASLIGYGYHGASNCQNRSIQEATLGFNRTFWKDARFGALNFIGQYSYLIRNPWYAAAGTPANANINMLFFDLRYTLPGSAPTLGK